MSLCPKEYMGDIIIDFDPRTGAGHGSKGQPLDHPRPGAAVENFALRHRSALNDPGARRLYD